MNKDTFKKILDGVVGILEAWLHHRTQVLAPEQPKVEVVVPTVEPVVAPVVVQEAPKPVAVIVPEVPKASVVVPRPIVPVESVEFQKAFTLAMQYEIGNWFNPKDLATQQGLIDTPLNRKACGYNITAGDSGGETKFGIAQNPNPDVVVRTLTLAEAENIYHIKYWLAAHCDKIGTPLSAIHFDTAVNMGIGRAAKLLQTAIGVTADGVIGPKTLAAVAAYPDIKQACSQYLVARQLQYDAIVLNNPKQAKFAAGWANRITSLKLWLSAQ